MPKKTKKQKLLAQRRRAPLPPAATHTPSQPAGDTSAFHLTLPTQYASAPAKHPGVTTEEFVAIKRDLAKTLVITTGIVIAELLLSYYLPH